MERDDALGPLVSFYRGRPLEWRDLLLLILPGTLAVLAPLLYGVWRADYAYTHYGPAAADAWSRPWYLAAAILLAIFALVAYLRIRRAHRFVAVHKNGLRLNVPSGRPRLLHRAYTLPWEDITGIASATIQDHLLNLPLRTHHQVTLYAAAGKPIRLGDALEHLPELASHIKASLYPRLLPGLQVALQGGQWLYFGPVAIHREALQLGPAHSPVLPRPPAQSRTRPLGARRRSNIPWSQIERLSVQSGYLLVEFKNRSSRRFPISSIPNFELLLQLVQQGVNA